MGLEYRSAGDIQQALATFEEVRRLDPDYLATYYQLGKTLGDLGETDRAREAFEAGIELAGRVGDSHTRGELHEALDEL